MTLKIAALGDFDIDVFYRGREKGKTEFANANEVVLTTSMYCGVSGGKYKKNCVCSNYAKSRIIGAGLTENNHPLA